MRLHDAHQLDLIELMDPDETAGVFPVREGLPAKTRGKGHVGGRQIFQLENLLPMDVGNRDFRRGNQKQVVGRRRVHLLRKLGELARAGQCGPTDQIRRSHFLVAMLSSMEIEHEVGEGANQAGPRPGVERKARAADFHAGGKIQDAKRRAQLPMGPRSKVEHWGIAPGAEYPVGRSIAIGHLIQREIGQGEEPLVEHCLQLSQCRIERPNLLTRGLQPLHELVGWLSCPLSPGDFIAGRVPLRLERFHPGQQLAALPIQLQHLVQQRAQRVISPSQQAGPSALGILAETLDVNHD